MKEFDYRDFRQKYELFLDDVARNMGIQTTILDYKKSDPDNAGILAYTYMAAIDPEKSDAMLRFFFPKTHEEIKDQYNDLELSVMVKQAKKSKENVAGTNPQIRA